MDYFVYTLIGNIFVKHNSGESCKDKLDNQMFACLDAKKKKAYIDGHWINDEIFSRLHCYVSNTANVLCSRGKDDKELFMYLIYTQECES